MRNSRAKKRGRPTRVANNNNNDSRYVYSSSKASKVEVDDDDEECSNQSSSTSKSSTVKYQTRSSRKPSYRIGITIERKKPTRGRQRRKGDDSEEEDYFVDDEYDEDQPNQSDASNANSDDDQSANENELEEEEENESEEVEEEEEDDEEISKKRFRPSREAAPLFLDDAEIPELNLPTSSEDLLITGPDLMRALSIYEIMRRFQNTLRLTPFRFEDFCVALLIDEQTYLLSEIHIQLLKALIREDDLVGTQHGPQDLRDSISIYLYLCDHLTWPEVIRIYLSSDLKKNAHIIKSCLDVNYPFSSIQNKLTLLEHMCEEFLNTQNIREVLNNEGAIKHEDNCRVCHKPGDLLCCEICSAVFHLTCLDPPLKQVPNEEWICPICKLNSVSGVTDCMSEFEKSGFLSRQEPIGWDRHGRKYWFLIRRLIVEDHKSDDKILYYSSRLQFDELLATLDADGYESDLCKALEEIKEDIYRQMAITEKLTKSAKGPRKSYLEVINEEIFIKQSAKLKAENDGTDEHNSNSANDEKFADLESKLAVDEDDLRGGGVQTRLKTGTLQPKSISLDPFKNRVNVYNSFNTFREDDSVIIIHEESKTLTRTPRKALPSNFNQINLFKLGLEGNYRHYQNVYSTNKYALSKLQQADDRDKKRHLSHKFSLTASSDLKWATYTHISTALQTTTLHGTKSMLINILRQALLYLETQFAQTFMHPNWQMHRNNWIRAVTMCSEPKEFSLALYILESSMKPVLFNPCWLESLGFTVLQRSTLLEREELKKKDKKERREQTDTTIVADSEASSKYYCSGAGVKLVFGKLKHQIWKQKGEEYRLSGIGGWNWLSSTRVKFLATEAKSSVEKELMPPGFDSPCELVDICNGLKQNDLPQRKFFPNVFKPPSSKLNTLLKSRTDMFNLVQKKKRLDSSSKKNGIAFDSLQCYSKCCDSSTPHRCYSPLCRFETTKEKSEDAYGDTSEHVDLLQVITVDGVEQFAKKVIPFNSKGQLPPSNRFVNGPFKSIMILPIYEMRKLGRNGGLREVSGFNYNCKINNNVWPYGMTPRPLFRTIWLLRTHYLNSLHSAALQLRVFWSSIRWDDLATKPPASGTNTITTENEVQTIEILKRRDLPPFGLRSEYLIRKIIVPIDLPVRQREVSTPNRSGLRERRRPDSPQVKGPRMNELWINEEDLELWEIRQFGEKAEKQQLLAKQRAAQEEKQRHIELIRKKNEEQRAKMQAESNKMVNGCININPTKSITSRLTSIFQNRLSSGTKLIGSPIIATATPPISTVNTPTSVTTFATIRTANGTFKIPVQQSKPVSPQLIHLRQGTQLITTSTNQTAIINNISATTPSANMANRAATYIVRSPNIASNRPIIISNSSLNGPIVRPVNNIQTNIKPSIPLISTSMPQKISTMTTTNAILTSTVGSKTISSALPATSTASTNVGTVLPTVNLQSSSPANQTGKSIQYVQLKLNDGRTHLLPLSSLAGGNQTLQFVTGSSPGQLRILKPVDSAAASKDSGSKPILVTGNSVISPNTFILSNMNNSKVIVQQQPTSATITTVASHIPSTNTVASIVSKKTETPKTPQVVPVVCQAPKPEPSKEKKVENSAPTLPNKLPASKPPNNAEEEFVLTAEMTQEIIRKALMDSSLQPDVSQKLMAYQRHHQEQLDSSHVSQMSPVKLTPTPSITYTSRSSRISRRGKYDSADYVTSIPRIERNHSYSRPDEDDVTRACRGVLKFLVDKLDKEERRVKLNEKWRGQRQRKAAQQKQKYRQNHIELLRRSILRRKAKMNQTIMIAVQKEFETKIAKEKAKADAKINSAILEEKNRISDVATPIATAKRKIEETISPIKVEAKIESHHSPPTSTPSNQVSQDKVNTHRPKRSRASASPAAAATATANLTNHVSPRKSSTNSGKPKTSTTKNELYCLCMKPYDDGSFMVGCDSCSNWYHPSCVHIEIEEAKAMNSYTCPPCKKKKKPATTSPRGGGGGATASSDDKRNSTGSTGSGGGSRRSSGSHRRTSASRSSVRKPRSAPKSGTKSTTMNDSTSSNEEQQSYCVCRKPYDPAQFYICCDRCQDWFHGRCVGITSAEAENIAEYTCPQCEGDNSCTILNIRDLTEDDYSSLTRLLKSIQTHKSAWPFLKPVDKRQVPDYYTIIKEPIDLKKIETRLDGRSYKKLAEFIYDMQKMFDNCRVYNAQASQYFQCAEVLEGFFVSKIKILRESLKENSFEKD